MNAVLFLLAATALLGSPGPGIAALIVAGRTLGLAGGSRLYVGMQLGLALAAAVSAAGLASLLTAVPALRMALTVVSVAYLAWLALGVVLGRIRLGLKGQRTMNLAMGGAILAAAGLALVG